MSKTTLDNEELVKLIQNGNDQNGCYMMQLWKRNLVLIRKTAEKYQKYDNMQDLMQEAFIGLKKAVEEYKPGYETKFMTYALFWIKAEISKYIRENGSMIRFPSHFISKLTRKKRFIQEYRCEFGEDPSDQQIADALDISVDKLKELEQREKNCRNLSSLEKPFGEDEDLKLEDCLSDGKIPQEEIEEQIYKEQRAKVVWNEVDQLPKRQRDVIRMRYKDDLTLEECAAALGIEYEAVRVHQIKAVKTLGSGKHRSILIHYSDDPYANAYKGGLNSFMVTQTSITEKIAMNHIKCHQDALMKISAFIQGREETEDGRE